MRIIDGEGVLELLRDGLDRIDPGRLARRYGIECGIMPDCAVFNYNQISSWEHRFDPVVRVCRQLILSPDLSRVLCRSFDRFLNHGEDPDSGKFDFGRAVCEEKLDGSLIAFWHDGRRWRHASRRRPDADVEISTCAGGAILADLVESVDISPILEKGNPAFTYLFELVSPMNRIVARYGETRLVMLAVRDRGSGKYIDRNAEGMRIGWKDFPRTFRFSGIHDMLESISHLPETEEGYVCRNGDWRLKVKNPAYVALSRMRFARGLSEKAILDLVAECEEAEYLSAFPEDGDRLAPYMAAREGMPSFFEAEYARWKDIPDRKEFALAVKDTPFNGVLFRMRDGMEARAAIDSMKPAVRRKMIMFFKENGDGAVG